MIKKYFKSNNVSDMQKYMIMVFKGIRKKKEKKMLYFKSSCIKWFYKSTNIVLYSQITKEKKEQVKP